MEGTPKFTDHDANQKHRPLDTTRFGEPEPVVLRFLDRVAAGRPRDSVRILDVGCGRGSRVAWLCDAGWDAWGADIVEDYIEAGRPYFDRRGFGAERLKAIDGELPFEEEAFDVVLSDQVVEHVQDLDGFVAGIARVSRRGSAGLHVYPATMRPLEPHLRQPLVHWLPRGTPRRAAIGAATRAGVGVNYFAERGKREQARIFAEFSEGETCYRLLGNVVRTFDEHGFATDTGSLPREKMRERLAGLPPSAVAAAASVYSRFLHTYLATTRR
jgi:SAM-dependent methyltransferase